MSKQTPSMIAAVDVYYNATTAFCAAVVFEKWSDATPLALYTHQTTIEAAYVPGRFYLRELGPIESILGQVCQTLWCVIVDGYVAFGPGRPALGRYLYERLGGNIAVIGVAKREFHTADWAAAIARGNSKRQLYITSIGVSQQTAAAAIAGMHGKYRMPSMLKIADRLSKNFDKTNG